MTDFSFKKATKAQSKLRLAFIGPAGSGKTYSSLRIATALVSPTGRIALIDTERGSASKYAHRFTFDVLELAEFTVENYIAAIHAAERAGYDCLIIDSLSHAWAGKGGLLEYVDTVTARSKSHNAFSEGWRMATPKHNELVDAMLQSTLHLVVTMRSKTEWVVEKDKDGRSVPRKIGLQPIQRDGLEYEFDVVGDIDFDNRYVISKTRCEDINGKVFEKPGEALAETLRAWLTDGTPVPVITQPAQSPNQTPPPSNGTPPSGGNGHQSNPASQQTVEIRTPDQVLAWIKQIAAQWEDKKISDGKKGLIAPVLETCFASGDATAKRHQVLKFLTGHSSLKEIPDNFLIALYQWLNPEKDSGGAWLPLATAQREANTIVTVLDARNQPALESAEPAPEFTPDDYDLSLEDA